MNDRIKREKISFGRVVSNNLYVLRYTISLDRKLVFFSVVADIISKVAFALFNTLMLKLIIDSLMVNKPFHEVMTLIIVGVIVIVAVQLLDICGNHYFETKFCYLSGTIQRIFIQKAAKIDLDCYDNPKYYDDFVIAASQSDEMLGKCIRSVSSLISSSLAVLTVGGIIFTINPIIAIFPVAGFIINLFTRFEIIKLEYGMNMSQQIIARKRDYSKRVFYQPEYAKELKLSDIAHPLRNQLDHSIEELRVAAKTYGIRIAIFSLINWISVFTILSFFCIPAFLGYLALVKRQISIGDVAAMNTAANQVRGYLDGLNYIFAEIQRVGLYADRFRRFVEYKVNIEDTRAVAQLPSELATLEIKNMSYKYDGSESYALKDVNITIRPKEKIALVGHNGAGKSTFVKLLMRLYDPTEGEIAYGGINIKDLSIKDYRSQIGVVFQDFQLYGASLAENVLMNIDDGRREDEIISALAKADFSKKLAGLSDGVHTEITREFSEEGTLLSGGEGQKLAIARMFAKPFRIAILDEPSSALDPVAEAKLNDSMLENAKDASIIFISHRLSTTKMADKIYMFEHGEIIEQGTHAELVALGGNYAAMFERQARYYIEDELVDAAAAAG